MSVLSPAAVAAIDDLELAARLVVEGARSGTHRSPFHGFTAEFSQHRPYRPGDDLKYLDWKLLARTDRLYSRQFRETTNMAVMLAIDTSASMDFPADADAPDAPPSKLRYAVLVASALAYLIVTQGDSVGLMTTTQERLRYLPARGGRSHLRALLAQLAGLTPAGSGAIARVVPRAADLLSRRGVIVVLSDFYDAGDDPMRELRRAARRGHDVSMLQILSPQELTFPYARDLEFEDLETGARHLVDAGAASAEYRGRLTAFLERCRAEAQRCGVEYTLLSTDVPPARALRSYLLRRGARTGAQRHQ